MEDPNSQEVVKVPRKDKQNYQFGPTPIGQVGLVDSSGKDITEESNQSIRSTLVKDETNIVDILEEQTQELRRIRRATELVVGEDVAEPED